MWVALAIAVFGVLVGVALGMRPSNAPAWIDPLRAAGLGSGLLAVFLQLMPEAAEDLGFLALVPFALAVLFASGVERLLFRRVGPQDEAAHAHAHEVDARANLELGFVALILHQFVEGVALGAIESDAHGAVTERAGVLFALAAHTVPVVAVFALAAKQVMGVPASLARGALLLSASAAGVLLSSSATVLGFVSESEGWVHGAVAGLLLHAILHVSADIHGLGAAPRTGAILRYAAFVGGASLVLVALLAKEHSGLDSWRGWAVVIVSAALALVVHRATPHNHHKRHDKGGKGRGHAHRHDHDHDHAHGHDHGHHSPKRVEAT